GAAEADPDRVYRGTSFERTATVGLTEEVGLNRFRDVKLRFLVVESSQLGAKYDASLDDRLSAAEAALRKLLRASSALAPPAASGAAPWARAAGAPSVSRDGMLTA